MPDVRQYESAVEGGPFREPVSFPAVEANPARPSGEVKALWYPDYTLPSTLLLRLNAAHWARRPGTDPGTAYQSVPIAQGEWVWGVDFSFSAASSHRGQWLGRDSDAIAYLGELDGAGVNPLYRYVIVQQSASGYSSHTTDRTDFHNKDTSTFLIGPNGVWKLGTFSWSVGLTTGDTEAVDQLTFSSTDQNSFSYPTDRSIIEGAGLYITTDTTLEADSPGLLSTVPSRAVNWVARQARGQVSTFSQTSTGAVLALEVIVEGRYNPLVLAGRECSFRGRDWAVTAVEEVGRRKYQRVTLTRLLGAG